MDLSVSDLSPRDRYKLLSALVVPRPIAWVTTLNGDGSVNSHITGNHVHDVGANGIMLAGPNDEKLVPKNNSICNNSNHKTRPKNRIFNSF